MSFPVLPYGDNPHANIAVNLSGDDLNASLPLHVPSPYTIRSMLVVNNTPATVFISRWRPGTVAQPNPAITIPPRFTMPVTGWFSEDMWITTDGTTVSSTDSLTVMAREDLAPFSAGSITPSALSGRNPYVPNGYDSWGFRGYLVSVATGSGGTDPTIMSPHNLLYGGWGLGSGIITSAFQQTSPNTNRPRCFVATGGAVTGNAMQITGTSRIGGSRALALGVPDYAPAFYPLRQYVIEAGIGQSSLANVNLFVGVTNLGVTDPFSEAGVFAAGAAYDPARSANWLAFFNNNGTITTSPTSVPATALDIRLVKAVISATQVVVTVDNGGAVALTTGFPLTRGVMTPRIVAVTRENVAKSLYFESLFDWVA